MLKYQSIQELVSAAEERGLKISELVLQDQAEAMEKPAEELYERMRKSFEVMRESVVTGQKKELRSMSGLTGGEGYLMKQYAESRNGGLCGDFLSRAIARALALVSLSEDRGLPEKDIVMSIFTAGAFGMVIAANSSIAGALGGCQAECGSAAGMAAASLVELMGGTPSQCADACAIAIANQLGLVCDPVAGLVEIPCIKRNVSGLMIAFSSADLALAGVGPKIPVDECVDAMREVGNALPNTLKETAGGGLATTPTGLKLRKQVFGK